MPTACEGQALTERVPGPAPAVGEAAAYEAARLVRHPREAGRFAPLSHSGTAALSAGTGLSLCRRVRLAPPQLAVDGVAADPQPLRRFGDVALGRVEGGADHLDLGFAQRAWRAVANRVVQRRRGRGRRL